MILSLSTGSVRKESESVIGRIHFIERNFSGLVDGVELCFIHKKDFYEFEFDKKSIEFLNGLEFNTLHAPVKDLGNGINEAEQILARAKELSKIVDIKFVTFHPNILANFSALIGSDLDICVENQPDGERRKGWQFPSEFEAFFNKWNNFGFCFDVNHAIANGIEPKEFIEKLKHKIEYIHLNATKPGNANHDLLVESGKETLEKIEPVFALQKPLVIEVNIPNEKTFLLKKEIELARKMGLKYG